MAHSQPPAESNSARSAVPPKSQAHNFILNGGPSAEEEMESPPSCEGKVMVVPTSLSLDWDTQCWLHTQRKFHPRE